DLEVATLPAMDTDIEAQESRQQGSNGHSLSNDGRHPSRPSQLQASPSPPLPVQSNSSSSNDRTDEAESRNPAHDNDGQKTVDEEPHHRTLRDRVLHFTPSWFSVTMGTGVLTILINLLPWPSIHPGLRYVAIIFLFLDIFIFITFTLAFAARYSIWPQVLPLTIKHPQKSMFLGTAPMGLITIISGIAQMGTREFTLGIGFALAASGLWWAAVLISLVTALAVPFAMQTYQEHQFEGTTATLLLPVVPLITAAATGSVLAELLLERYPTYAFTILTVSYMVLGIGLPVACFILTLYFQRLLLFKAVPRDVIISSLLPLGPAGQGGEALLHLGQVAMQLFPRIATAPGSGVPMLQYAGYALFGAGLGGALLLWGLGMWWFGIAILTIVREVRRGRLPFSLGWWSATFPIASLAIVTVRLALVLDSLALKITYTVMTIAVLGLWALVFVPTARGFYSGKLLVAPCLATIPLQ
ncbi:Plasma membrane sulfite pump involved in sulfite metabolism, partial [Tilletia horrida]